MVLSDQNSRNQSLPIMTETSPFKCGCKGIRKCAICQPDLLSHVNSSEIFSSSSERQPTYVYCIACGDRFRPLTSAICSKLESFLRDQTRFECVCGETTTPTDVKTIHLDGVYVKSEFLSSDEEAYLVEQIDGQNRWVESQSGRFKQDFGPKANFNKRKLKYSTFTGKKQFEFYYWFIEIVSEFLLVEIKVYRIIPGR